MTTTLALPTAQRGATAALSGVTYSRSSSAKQVSIDAQTAENLDAARAEGFHVVRQLTDPVSASRYGTKTRREWAELIAMLPDVDVVILWEPSRGDRTLASWALFLDLCREHDVKIHATSHRRTYDLRNARDMRSLSEDGVDSAYESDRLSERVRRGTGKAAREGKPAGRTAYGLQRRYSTGTDGGKPRYVDSVPHPVTAPVVVRIFEDVARGVPIYQVRKALDAEGIPTPTGRDRWSASTVRQIALCRTYAPHPDDPTRGCLDGTNGLHIGTWPPLISAATWEAVQATMGATCEADRKTRKSAAPGAVKYLLSGSIKLMTTPCGASVAGYPDSPQRPGYYSCTRDGCVNVPMAEVDHWVAAHVLGRLGRREAAHLYAARGDREAEAATTLARLRAKLAEATESFERVDGTGISAAAMAGIERKLTPLIEAAQRAAQPVGASVAMLEMLDAAERGEEHVAAVWDTQALPGKRGIIADLCESITLAPSTTRAHRWLSKQDRYDLVASRVNVAWRNAPAS